MAKAAIMLAARGTMRTTTLQAIPVEDLIARAEATASLVADAPRSLDPPRAACGAPRAGRRRRTVPAAPSRRSGAAPGTRLALRSSSAPSAISKPRAHLDSNRDRTSTRVPGSHRSIVRPSDTRVRLRRATVSVASRGVTGPYPDAARRTEVLGGGRPGRRRHRRSRPRFVGRTGHGLPRSCPRDEHLSRRARLEDADAASSAKSPRRRAGWARAIGVGHASTRSATCSG